MDPQFDQVQFVTQVVSHSGTQVSKTAGSKDGPKTREVWFLLFVISSLLDGQMNTLITLCFLCLSAEHVGPEKEVWLDNCQFVAYAGWHAP